MMFIRLVPLICLFTADIQATSHWMVTETGLIQPKENSPFIMENPFDLLSFLNQDTRWENIFIIYHDLIQRQKRINKYWYQLHNAADMPKHLQSNEHCKKVANVDVLDWYTSFMEDGKFKGIQDKEFLIQNYEHGDSNIPDCKKISSLTFSMFAFEHLESMINRQSLNATPEFALPELFAPIMTTDQFGHWLSDILRRNSSSWLHYNLAAIYWRVKGNVPKAIECSRRAIHYAPRKHKSIPLLCLGTILHRSQQTSDAIIVLGSAADHDPQFPLTQFALGLAHAVAGHFNTSLKHFDTSIKLHSKFELAHKFRNGILCHIDMKVKIDAAKKSVKRLCDELDNYIKTEMIWLRIQTAFLKTMKHEEKYDYKNMDYNLNKMSIITGLKISELKMEAEKYSVLQYFFDGPTYKENWSKEKGVHSIITAQSLHRVVRHVATSPGFPPRIISSNLTITNKTKMLKEIGPIPALPSEMLVSSTYISPAKEDVKRNLQKKIEITVGNIETGVLEPDRGEPLYPANMKVNRNRELFDTDPEWPSHRYCEDNVSTFPDNLEAIYPVFMPFENKGIKQSRLLTERIGVPALRESALPWHPPLCPHGKDAAALAQKKGINVTLVNEAIAVDYLKRNLMRYVTDVNLSLLNQMQDAEIGQRIHTAITKKVAPLWVVYTVAGVYWRARRERRHAAACLVAARGAAPPALRDVPLVSLGSLLLDMGLLHDADLAAQDAYKINSYEPSTNFLLAEINMLKKNHGAMLFHLKQTVRVEPMFLNGLARRLLSAWACVLKQVHSVKQFEESMAEKQFCAEVEPGVSMVCERDGTNCHITNNNCNAVHTQSESALLRLLEQKDRAAARGRAEGEGEEEEEDGDEVGAEVFTAHVANTPRDGADVAAHAAHHARLLRDVHARRRGCGTRPCHEITPEDLSLKEEDCSFQYLQLDYWLHVISFRQIVTETDTKLPSEILSKPGSSRLVPECEVGGAARGDFYVSRVLRVRTEHWEPHLTAMHQFADFFNYYDYATLGAKIAKYLDTKPTSWVGLAAAAWWCGAGGRGACAVRCAAAAAHAARPAPHLALRSFAALLHMQEKSKEAKDIAYLAFYASPKNKIEAFLVAVSHTYRSEYEQAVWMYRYALSFDENFLPAKACLHITMCLMLFQEPKMKVNEIPA